MKKVLIASVALLFAAITNVNAQVKPQAPVDKKETVTTPQTNDQETKTPVKPEALPDPVKTAIAGEDYKGWVASSAFVIKTPVEYYEVVLTKDKETKTVKFAKDGKEIM